MSAMCKICEKEFSSQFNLNKHLENVHKTKPVAVSYKKSVWSYKCEEPSCNSSFYRNQGLIDHLLMCHNIEVESETRQFKTLQGEIRDNIGNQLKRVDLITKQDLENVKRSFKIDMQEGVRNKDDVLQYSRDKMVEHLIKETKGKSSIHKRNILQRHTIAISSQFSAESIENSEEVMDLSSDLVAIQGILISAVKTTGEFTKINYRGGNEQKILDVMIEIQKFISAKNYIKDAKINSVYNKQLEDIVLFLALNTTYKEPLRAR
ncbi:hypothetical protein NQ314_014131 [Rhamnusium bicolor]|uniref:C2H2-type domain-containing protein n=1 Tax=Rhamnusium bicolor TaxID=1586634 RepID=A0AAV8X2R4_9CUCU|nr:hypothetical protein NQ314_014131 [Rhamnusium bicolor]